MARELPSCQQAAAPSQWYGQPAAGAPDAGLAAGGALTLRVAAATSMGKLSVAAAMTFDASLAWSPTRRCAKVYCGDPGSVTGATKIGSLL